MVPGTKIDTGVATVWGFFTEVENMGYSRFRGKLTSLVLDILIADACGTAGRWKVWAGA